MVQKISKVEFNLEFLEVLKYLQKCLQILSGESPI